MTLLAYNNLELNSVYVSIPIFLHLKGKPVSSAIQAQIMATSEHEYVLRKASTLCTRLGFLIIHMVDIFKLYKIKNLCIVSWEN